MNETDNKKVTMLPESKYMAGQSENILDLLKALSDSRKKMESLKTTKGQRTYYAKLDAILDAIEEYFEPNGVHVTHSTTVVHYPQNNSFASFLRTQVIHIPTGQWMSCIKRITDECRQEHGGDLTYHKRYSTSNLLGICPAEESSSIESNSNKNNTEKKDYGEYKLTSWQLEKVNNLLVGKPELREKVCQKAGVTKIEDIKQKKLDAVLKYLQEQK